MEKGVQDETEASQNSECWQRSGSQGGKALRRGVTEAS